MEHDEARIALEAARATDRKMGERMTWPFHRHAMFGLMEGLIVVGIGTPGDAGLLAVVAGVSLIMAMAAMDRRRHGMFVSGWQSKAARPMMWGLVAFIGVMLVASLSLKPESGVEPWVVALGGVTLLVCTIASMQWERLYRRELGPGDAH